MSHKLAFKASLNGFFVKFVECPKTNIYEHNFGSVFYCYKQEKREKPNSKIIPYAFLLV